MKRMWGSSLLFGFIVLLASACGGGGGGGVDPAGNNNNNSNGNTTSPTAVGMSHESTYDPVSDPYPTARGVAVSQAFGSKHERAQFAFNGIGEGMAIWQTVAGENEKVVYATYNPITSQWSEEQTLFVVTPFSTPPFTRVSLAANNDSFAISWQVEIYENNTWVDYNYAKVYSNGNWSAAMLLNVYDTSTYFTHPKTASNGTDFMFAWQEDGTVCSRKYIPGQGLSNPYIAYSISSVYVEDLELVSNGSSYALKLEHGTSSTSISQRFMAVALFNGSSWTTSMTTEANVGSITRSAIAGNGSGYLLTWTQDNVIQYSAFNGNVWSSMSALPDVDNKAYRLTASGNNYLLSWVTLDVSSTNSLHTKIYSGGTWGGVIIPESLTTAVDSFDVVATSSGYAFALRSYNVSSYDLFLHTYSGGASGSTTPVDAGTSHIYTPVIGFDGTNSWLAWQQHDGINGMQLRSAAYTNNTLQVAEFSLNLLSHGGGVTSGKVARTASGVRVAAWGQEYFDETQTERRAAYVRIDDGTGVWSPPALLRTTADVRDVVAVGETIVVLLEVVGGLDALEYRNGTWYSTFADTGFVYEWDYAIANNRMVLVYEVVNDIRTVVYENNAWSTWVSMIQSGESGGFPTIATNGNDYLVTWKEYLSDGSRTIRARRYDAVLAQWDNGSIVETYNPVYGGGNPIVSSNGTDFMVTWARDDGTNTISLYASNCTAAGVCGSATLLENLAGSVGHYEIASNGSGYAIAFSHNVVMGVIYAGSSWGAPEALGNKAGNQSLKLSSNGNGYLAAWYTFETNSPVYAARYTPSTGWNALESLKTSTGSTGTFDWFQIYPRGNQYIVTWLAYKPGYHQAMNNLYTNSWNGSTWSGEQQINTGKFEVGNFDIDIVNTTTTLSWIQAHETLLDQAAPALWELSL